MERKYYVFRGIDHASLQTVRAELLNSHREYVRKAASVKMIHGGPLLDPQDQTIGSCLILEANSKSEVDSWLASEPFNSAGLFANSTVDLWGWSYGR